MKNLVAEVFEILSVALPGVFVTHGCPQTLNRAPCVTFYESGGDVAGWADDGAYCEVFGLVVDFWADDWGRVCEMFALADDALGRRGFARKGCDDNVSFGIFNKRDASARKTAKYWILV